MQKELNAAYMKEVKLKKIVVLPVLIEECEIPPLISGKQFANFASDYKYGLKRILDVLTPELIKFEKVHTKTMHLLSVLITNDDKYFLNSIAHWFETLGYSVSSATGIHEGIELAHRNSPNIVFLDLWWDYRWGACVSSQELKKVAPNAILVGLSGYENPPKATEFGLDYVLKKPPSSKTIL